MGVYGLLPFVYAQAAVAFRTAARQALHRDSPPYLANRA